jgi:hypothetical protein
MLDLCSVFASVEQKIVNNRSNIIDSFFLFRINNTQMTHANEIKAIIIRV